MEDQDRRRKKENKKGGYSNKYAREPEYFTTPITGFLITSNQNQEKNAVRDAYNFLNRYVENNYQREIDRILDDNENVQKKLKTENPTNTENAEETKEVNENDQQQQQPQEEAQPVHQSASAMLEKELKTYSKETRQFYNVDTNCKGIIFIKVNPLFKDVLDVKKIANQICRDVRENNIPVSRFCFKAVPIQFATKASLATFQDLVKGLIEKKFKPENPKKWVFHFKCRNNNKFTQKPFLDYLLESIGKEHSVDYKNPDYTVFLEINNHMMCLSVLKKFHTFKNYSLQLPGSNPAQNPKKKETKDQEGNADAPKESLVGELEFEDAPREEQEKNDNNQEKAQDNEPQPLKENPEESDEDVPLV